MEDPNGAAVEQVSGADGKPAGGADGKQPEKQASSKQSGEEVQSLKNELNALKGQITWKEKKLEEREKAVQEAETKQKEAQWEIDVWGVASEKKVDPQALKEKLSELGIDHKDKISKIAELMKGGFKPASTKTVAGTTDTSNMSADQKLKEGFAKVN